MHNGLRQVFTLLLTLLSALAVGLGADIVLACRLRTPARRAVFRQRRLPPPLDWHEAGRLLIGFALLNMVIAAWDYAVLTLDWIAASGTGDFILVLQGSAIQIAALALVMASVRSKQAWQDRALRRTPHALLVHVRQATLSCAGMMPLFWLASVVSWLLLTHTPYEFEPQTVVRLLHDGQTPRWLNGLLIAIAVTVAPIWEETLFRGILMPLFSRRLGRAPAILLSSALFALMHVHVPSLLPLFVIACAFSLAYIYTGSMAVPILMHALFNAIQLLMVALV